MLPLTGLCERFEVKGFRQFHEAAEIKFEQINLLIGTNGSGKSTFLRLMRLFHDVVLMGEMDHIPTDLLHEHDLVTASERPIEIQFDVRLQYGVMRYELEYEVEKNYSWRLKSCKATRFGTGEGEQPFLNIVNWSGKLPANAIRPRLIRQVILWRIKEQIDSPTDAARIDYLGMHLDPSAQFTLGRGVDFIEALLYFFECHNPVEQTQMAQFQAMVDHVPVHWYDVFIGVLADAKGWMLTHSWKTNYFADDDRLYLKEIFSDEGIAKREKDLFWLLVAVFHESTQREAGFEAAEFIQSHLVGPNDEDRNAFLRSVGGLLRGLHSLIAQVLLHERVPRLFFWNPGGSKAVRGHLVLKPEDLGRLTSKHASLHQPSVLNQILIKWLSEEKTGFMERHEGSSVERTWKSALLERNVKIHFDFHSGEFEMSVEDADGLRPLAELSSGEQRGCFLELLIQANVLFFLEEPENSLHPAVQEQLGRIMVKARFAPIEIQGFEGETVRAVSYRTAPPVFIESHSDHFLIGMQRAVSELYAELDRGGDASGIQIVEFQDVGNEHSKVECMGMSALGETSKALTPGFFSRTLPTIKFFRNNSN